MKNKVKKIIIICIVIIAVLAVILAIVLNFNKKPSASTSDEVISSKKIQRYVGLLTSDYYMKYLQTVELDTDGDGINDTTQEITIEFQVVGDRMVKKSNEENVGNIRIITEKNAYYYVMDDSKIILYYPLTEEQQDEYQLYFKGISAQVFEDEFLSTGTENINNDELYYEEYASEDETMEPYRYYFNDADELKYIKATTDGVETLITILQLNDNIDNDMFKVPTDYQIYDASNLIAPTQ